MTLEVLKNEFTVCRLSSFDGAELDFSPCFFARTDNEISLVCESGFEPKNVIARESGWRAFRVCGSLDFSLVGILAGLTSRLADAGVSVFAVSTFLTDYVLVKSGDLGKARAALEKSGYEFVE